MIRFIIKRLLLMIPVLLGVLFIIFTINQMTPGDPVLAILGTSVKVGDETYNAMAKKLGVDQPFFVQFWNYLKNLVLHLDLGTSYDSRRAVTTEVASRFPVTLKLGLIGMLITICLGIPFGVISAVKQRSALDYTVTVFALIFASMPAFWVGLMLMIVFSLNLGWLPSSGIMSWQSWILPSLTIGLAPVASVCRMTRSAMLDVVREDYIRTARAKGLKESKVIIHHVIKNGLIPVVTVIGTQLGGVVAGSVVVESVFSIPGMGLLVMNAINNKDYPVIMGSVLIMAFSVCIINLLTDLVYGFIDPRIKAQYAPAKTKTIKAETQTNGGEA